MTSLLRMLATEREATPPLDVRYNASVSASEVFEGGAWVPSWLSTALAQTKKCDIETGEDQKGT
ncbi:MAG: hypothetical protein GY788_01685 [bacterium]|nr:hypothetical protein [bacterium]